MPDRSTATDHRHQEEAAHSGYFASRAEGRYFLVTTSRHQGAPVSARVQGIVASNQAYFGAGSRSGTVKRIRADGTVQVAACDAMGMVSARRLITRRPPTGQLAPAVAACSFPVPRNYLSPPGPADCAVFCGTFMIAKDFAPEKGIKPFAIMKCLVRYLTRKSHPSLRAHSPRALDAFYGRTRDRAHLLPYYARADAHGKQCW